MLYLVLHLAGGLVCLGMQAKIHQKITVSDLAFCVIISWITVILLGINWVINNGNRTIWRYKYEPRNRR